MKAVKEVKDSEAPEKEESTAKQLPEPSGYRILIALRPDAYQDKQRFPNGAYCKEGDWIIMRSYTGTRFLVHGKEFRLINDDSVEAVVEDPRGVVKA